MSEKSRNFTKHNGKMRKCDYCNEKFEVINTRQRFCSRPKPCYGAWHSKDKNKKSNAKRRNDGRYVFRHILDRCNNPESKSYKDYGGKGVRCKFKNLEDFQRVYFRTKECENCGIILNDENRRGRDGRNIQRLDSTGHYEEKNCAIYCKACNNYADRNDKRGWF